MNRISVPSTVFYLNFLDYLKKSRNVGTVPTASSLRKARMDADVVSYSAAISTYEMLGYDLSGSVNRW